MTPDVRHRHLVVRAEISTPPQPRFLDKAKAFAPVRWVSRLIARRAVARWMQALIERIDMKIMFGPRAEYCMVEGNRGMTAFAIIETSHIVLHTWDECSPAILQLDVYTCSDLVVEDVIEMIEVWGPSKVEYKFIDREHDLTLLSEMKA